MAPLRQQQEKSSPTHRIGWLLMMPCHSGDIDQGFQEATQFAAPGGHQGPATSCYVGTKSGARPIKQPMASTSTPRKASDSKQEPGPRAGGRSRPCSPTRRSTSISRKCLGATGDQGLVATSSCCGAARTLSGLEVGLRLQIQSHPWLKARTGHLGPRRPAELAPNGCAHHHRYNESHQRRIHKMVVPGPKLLSWVWN